MTTTLSSEPQTYEFKTIAVKYTFKYKLDFHKSITDAPTDQVQYQVDAYRSAESS